jgi:hypothetical protein
MSSAYEQFRKIESGAKRKRRQSFPIEFRPVAESIRCRCGKCRQCVDEARRDRIFNEKFADPDYYTERPSPQGSSLGWLR